MSVLAVIPAYQEALRLPSVLEAVAPHVDGIVVVDDGSLDQTAEAAVYPKVHLVRHALNRGQGAALRTGTAAALELGAAIVLHLDADGQHDPSCIQALLAPLQAGEADVVIGSRFLGIRAEGMPRHRRALLWGARHFSRWVLGIPATVSDPQSGCRALSAVAAREIVYHQDRMAHASEILRQVTRSTRWRWREVPIRVHYSAETLQKGQRSFDAVKVVWQLVLGAFYRS